MSRHLASFLSKIYKLSVQKLEYSAVSRLLKNMAEDTTCNAEQFSEEPHKTQGENDGLKRCLDDDNTTEDTGKKRMKTEPGEKVQENASLRILQSAHIELQGDVPLHSNSPPPSPPQPYPPNPNPNHPSLEWQDLDRACQYIFSRGLKVFFSAMQLSKVPVKKC